MTDEEVIAIVYPERRHADRIYRKGRITAELKTKVRISYWEPLVSKMSSLWAAYSQIYFPLKNWDSLRKNKKCVICISPELPTEKQQFRGGVVLEKKTDMALIKYWTPSIAGWKSGWFNINQIYKSR